MNTFSLIKLSTLVGFLVFGQYGHSAAISKADVDEDTTCSTYENKSDCEGWQANYKRKIKKEDDKEFANKCVEAKKKYDDAAVKSRMACGAFEKTDSKTGKFGAQCSKRIAECRAKKDALFTPTSDQSGKSGTGMLQEMAMMGIKSKMGIVDTASADASKSVSCLKEPDTKERKQAEKDRRKEIKDLEDKIKKESDEQAKLLEKQREKIDEIKKKENEIIADAKKELLKKDAKERDQAAEIRKATLDTSKRLRQYATGIIKEQQALAKERLNYQKAMLDLSKDRISAKCKQEFEALKAGIVNTKVGDPKNTTAEQKQLEALAAQYKGKVSGTAQLASLLNMAKKACFEKADAQIADINLGSSQNIQNINGRIEELQSSINDEKKSAENSNTAIEEMKKGMNEEKLAEEKEKLDKLSQLNQEVISFTTSTNEKLAISKAMAAKLQEDIKNLKLKTDFDSETAFEEAEGMISTAEAARSSAAETCGCTGGGTTKDKECARLMDDKIDLNAKPKASNSTTK